MNSVPETIVAHDRVSDVYKGKLFTRETQAACRARIDWMVGQAKGPKILDVGCSQGITSILLATAGFQVVGIDPDPEAIAYAKEDAKSSLNSEQLPSFINATVESLTPSEVGSFQTVLVGEVIEHFADPKEVIVSALRFLDPGGLLILTTPFGLKPSPDHKSTFTLSSLVALLDGLVLITELSVVDDFIRVVAYAHGGQDRVLADLTPKALLERTERATIQSQDTLFKRIRMQRNSLLKAAAEGNESGASSYEVDSLKQAIDQLETQLSKTLQESAKRWRTGTSLRQQIIALQADRYLSAHFRDSVAARLGCLVVESLKSPKLAIKAPFRLLKLFTESLQTATRKALRRFLKLKLRFSDSEFERRLVRLMSAEGSTYAYNWMNLAVEHGLVAGSDARRIGFSVFESLDRDRAVTFAREIVSAGESFDGFVERLLALRESLFWDDHPRMRNHFEHTLSLLARADLNDQLKDAVSYLSRIGILEEGFSVDADGRLLPYRYRGSPAEHIHQASSIMNTTELESLIHHLKLIPEDRKYVRDVELFKGLQITAPERAIEFGEQAFTARRSIGVARILSKFLQSRGSLYRVEQLAQFLASASDHHRAHLRVVQSQLKLLTDGYPLPARRHKPSRRRQPGDPIRLFYILHNSLPFSNGGYASRTHGILHALNQLGVDAHALTRFGYPCDRQPAGSKVTVSPSAQIDSVPYHRLIAPSGRGFGRTPLIPYLDDFCAALESKVRANPVSVLHAASNFMNGIAANVVGRRLGIPTIYEVRGLWEVTRMSREPSWEGSDYYNMQVRMECEACNGADSVVAITHALKAELVRRGVAADRITVIPNGVDSSRFTPVPRDQALAAKLKIGNEPVIGYVGTIVHYEGLDLLLAAVAKLKSKGLRFTVLIVGDGAALEELQAQAKELEIEALVRFTGRVPHLEVERYYSLINVCPFPRKGLPVCEMVSPMKPFEAMCMEKTVIASNVAALTEIVQDGVTGLLFQKDSVDSLADALERSISAAEERAKLGRAARLWAMSERDWKALAQRFVEVYQGVMKG